MTARKATTFSSGPSRPRRSSPNETISAAFARSPRPTPAEDSLDGLAGYRRALDCWHAAGSDDDMPQPRDHGIRLPDLDARQVLWGTP